MYITLNIVSKEVTELNKKDMSTKIQLVGGIDKKPDPAQINIVMNGRCNSTTIVSSKKLGQNASPTNDMACETIKDSKYIISVCFRNTLCWAGA